MAITGAGKPQSYDGGTPLEQHEEQRYLSRI
jgi:hypothetical protein